MNKLTKAQVLALFLGTASAEITVLDILNGISSDATIPDGQTAFPASLGGECDNLGACEDSAGGVAQRCAELQVTGAAEGTNVNTCVAEKACGSVGKVNNVTYAVQCWTAPAEDAGADAPWTKPDQVVPDDYLKSLEDLITDLTITWDDATDLFVSSRFNYQDGWWILNSTADDDNNGKWVETDKPVNNRCLMDWQCEGTEDEPIYINGNPDLPRIVDGCCATYPDNNNRRCIEKADSGKLVTQFYPNLTTGPISVTPICTSLNDDEGDDIVPENAQDDISKGALAEAKEELENFFANQLSDAKKEAGYDTDECDETCKSEFDKGAAAQAEKRVEEWNELKVLAGYDNEGCDDVCKKVFEADLLQWEQDRYTACGENADSIECSKALDIKKGVEEERAKSDTNYYALDAEGRGNYDTAAKAEVDKIQAQITAAVVDQPYAAGAAGSDCGDGCTTLGHCCGTSALDGTDETQENICAPGVREVMILGPAAESGTWTDRIGREWTHTCLAMAKLGSAVATAAVAALYM